MPVRQAFGVRGRLRRSFLLSASQVHLHMQVTLAILLLFQPSEASQTCCRESKNENSASMAGLPSVAAR